MPVELSGNFCYFRRMPSLSSVLSRSISSHTSHFIIIRHGTMADAYIQDDAIEA